MFDEEEAIKMEESKEREKKRGERMVELVELIKQDIATPIEPFDGEDLAPKRPKKRRTIAHVPLKNINN